MSVDLNAELAALRQLVLNSKDDLTRYRAAHSNDCFSTVVGDIENVAFGFEQTQRQSFSKSQAGGDGTDRLISIV